MNIVRQKPKAVIIVPTVALVNQWEEACENFNFNQVIKYHQEKVGK